MLNKYLYTGVLLGTIILAGCSAEEETEGQLNEENLEGLTDGNRVEVVMPVTPLDLTQEQKKDYHKEYLEIVENLNVEYQTANMKLVPLDEFLEEDWTKPEEFRERLIAILKKGVVYETATASDLFNSHEN